MSALAVPAPCFCIFNDHKAHNDYSYVTLRRHCKREENVMENTSPWGERQEIKGIVYFAWLYRETACMGHEKKELWLAQPLTKLDPAR